MTALLADKPVTAARVAVEKGLTNMSVKDAAHDTGREMATVIVDTVLAKGTTGGAAIREVADILGLAVSTVRDSMSEYMPEMAEPRFATYLDMAFRQATFSAAKAIAEMLESKGYPANDVEEQMRPDNFLWKAAPPPYPPNPYQSD